MKIVFKITIFTAFLWIHNVYSQVGDISPDRPGAGNGPALMDKGFFQVELGGSVERTGKYDMQVTGDVVTVNTHDYPSVLLRYGFVKNIELRLGIDYFQLKQKAKFEGDIQTDAGFSPLNIGTKIKLFSEKGSVPEAAFLFTVSVPFKDNNPFQSDYLGTEFQLAMQNTLNKRFSLSYNIGGSWGAGNPGVTGFYSLSLGANIVKKLSAFAEIYGYLPEKSSPDHRFDAGLTYLIMKNIQADVSGGFGISEKSPDYFIGLGVSVRFPK